MNDGKFKSPSEVLEVLRPMVLNSEAAEDQVMPLMLAAYYYGYAQNMVDQDGRFVAMNTAGSLLETTNDRR